MTVAQKFIPVEVLTIPPSRKRLLNGFIQLWVPFFNAIQFVLGVRMCMHFFFRLCSQSIPIQTYFNMRVKALKMAAAKKEKLAREKEERKD